MLADAEALAYEAVLTAPARRALADRLPESVAAAVVDFVTSALLLAGSPLQGFTVRVGPTRHDVPVAVVERHAQAPRTTMLRRGRPRRPPGAAFGSIGLVRCGGGCGLRETARRGELAGLRLDDLHGACCASTEGRPIHGVSPLRLDRPSPPSEAATPTSRSVPRRPGR